MRRVDIKSILVIGIIGYIANYMVKNSTLFSAEAVAEAPTEMRDLYGSVVLVKGQQSQDGLAFNQRGGYELDSANHSLGQNFSGRLVG